MDISAINESIANSFTLTKEQEQRKILLNKLKDTSIKLNNSIDIPVQWTVGRHCNLGINNLCAVQHILLLKPLSSGIINRAANDFLCGRLIIGNNNKVESKFHDGEGRLYQAPVSCEQCLKIAKRWESK